MSLIDSALAKDLTSEARRIARKVKISPEARRAAVMIEDALTHEECAHALAHTLELLTLISLFVGEEPVA